MNIRYFLFLSLGVCRTYSPSPAGSPENRKKRALETWPKLSETDGSRICRRNILALASILVIAGLAGADPTTLRVFDLQFSGKRGVWVLAAAAILAQLYWYAMRYHHLIEDGKTLDPPGVPGRRPPQPFDELDSFARKASDLWANRAALGLTFASWAVLACWFVPR